MLLSSFVKSRREGRRGSDQLNSPTAPLFFGKKRYRDSASCVTRWFGRTEGHNTIAREEKRKTSYGFTHLFKRRKKEEGRTKTPSYPFHHEKGHSAGSSSPKASTRVSISSVLFLLFCFVKRRRRRLTWLPFSPYIFPHPPTLLKFWTEKRGEELDGPRTTERNGQRGRGRHSKGGEGKDKTKPPVSDRTHPTLPSQRQRGQSPPTFPNSTKHIQYR